ncbi:hypothetical protein BaRGS_00029552 [Batillaria attramentaria]|uniref:Uncharacterized protein n=1 Tax=Batillaria attramentaria TaxID=370345 RepID=A0ABD0JWA9_9CAEN
MKPLPALNVTDDSQFDKKIRRDGSLMPKTSVQTDVDENRKVLIIGHCRQGRPELAGLNRKIGPDAYYTPMTICKETDTPAV